jgi:hypothetical protein
MGELGTPVPPAWDHIHGLRSTDIADRALSLQSTLQSIKVLQDEAENEKREIERLMDAAKASAVMVGELRVSVVKGRTTRKLDTDKLLKLGVPESTIRAAQVETVGKPYVRLFSKEEAEQ